jgi:hypothetical protein
MVLITYYKQRPICTECELKDISEEITDRKWKKFFDINPELYRKSPFLRSIKRNYLRQGMLTKKQKEAFVKVVKEGAKGQPKKIMPAPAQSPYEMPQEAGRQQQ